MVFWCHLGNAVEKTAEFLSHLYVIGVKIVLRDIVGTSVSSLHVFVNLLNAVGLTLLKLSPTVMFFF